MSKDKQIEQLKNNITSLKEQFDSYKKSLQTEMYKHRLAIDVYIKKTTAEWRVVEEDGSWGDYTGNFFCLPEDEREVILEKARKHYDTYFVDSKWHRKKKLGLFITTPTRGKELIETKDTE